MLTANINSYLHGNRLLDLGEPYEFELQIKDIFPLVQIYKVTLYLDNFLWIWNVNANTFPFHLRQRVSLPPQSNSYYPKFQVEGFNNDGFSQVVDLYFPRPVISTNVRPIFDARLARSNSPRDVALINPIRKLLNIWGFDCSTLGIEVQA